MKRLGCIQPSYIPWRGYFHIIQRSNVFVFHDDIRYTKEDWRNRNRIKTASGLRWLTIPVQRATTKGNIVDVLIDNTQPWGRKHWAVIEQAYHAAPYFDQYCAFFKDVLTQDWEKLSELDIYLTEKICEFLGFETEFHRSSEFGINGVKTDRLVQLCEKLEITHYLSGPAAQAYIEPEKLKAVGVSLEYQLYDYPDYPQLYEGFEPNVSIIDLLFNCGPTALDQITQQGTNRPL